MADKKFIRDLNSLIRIDTRKRLKEPATRPAILGGRGISGASNDVPPEQEELLYVRHYGGGVDDNAVYTYDKNGGAPVYVARAGDRAGLGIYNADTYSGSYDSTGNFYKNGSLLASRGSEFALVAVNSTHVIIQDSLYDAHRYTLAGVYVDTFALPYDYAGQQAHTANDYGVGYTYSQAIDSVMAIADYSGTQIALDSYTNFSYSHTISSCRKGFLFVDMDDQFSPVNYVLKIFNNAGTKIAEHLINALSLEASMGGDVSVVGITSDRIYLCGASSAQPYCAIYEHTFTLDGAGLAVGATLGALLHTVPTPQYNNNVWGTWQNATMNGALMR